MYIVSLPVSGRAGLGQREQVVGLHSLGLIVEFLDSAWFSYKQKIQKSYQN